jgi:hypothetical protein
VGGFLPWFSLSIEIRAADLVPEEVTTLLGVTPTLTRQKGKPWIAASGKEMIGKIGRWALELSAEETDEWDLPEAVRLLLSRLPPEPTIWKELASRAEIRLSAAVFLERFQQGLSFDSALLKFLAEREIALDLSVYAGDDKSSEPHGQTRRPSLKIVGSDPPQDE